MCVCVCKSISFKCVELRAEILIWNCERPIDPVHTHTHCTQTVDDVQKAKSFWNEKPSEKKIEKRKEKM